MKNLYAALVVFLSLFITQPTFAEELDIYDSLGGNFTLTGAKNAPVSLNDFKDKVVMLTFGYTFCPDICPINLGRIQQVVKRIGGSSKGVQGIFVSFDPERDNSEQLEQYVEHFDSSFVGLTGEKDQIAKVARQFGAAYFRQDGDTEAGYLFGHTDYIYLLDKQSRIRALYKGSASLDQMAEGVEQLLDN